MRDADDGGFGDIRVVHRVESPQSQAIQMLLDLAVERSDAGERVVAPVEAQDDDGDVRSTRQIGL